MGNIVRFPKHAEAPQHAEPNAEAIEADEQLRASLAGALAWPLRALRLPVFLVLYWLRLPVLLVCNLVSVPAMLAFVAGLWIASHAPQYYPMVWAVGAVSFVAFVLRWCYDLLLMWLDPAGTVF